MGFVPYSGFKLVCDECGEPDGFTAEGQGYTVAETLEEARQNVLDSEGLVRGDGKVFCSGCMEEIVIASEDEQAAEVRDRRAGFKVVAGEGEAHDG